MNFKLFGVEFILSYPLVAGLALLLICDPTGMAVCAVVASVCHEMGHIVAMRFYKTQITSIRLSVFDIGITDVQKYRRGIKAEIIITLSGVFVNIVLFLVAIMVYNSCKFYLFRYFALANLSLGLFNALPVESLDGGNALKLILQRNFTDRVVYIITLIVSLLCVLPLGFISFMALLKSPYNFTMLFATLYLISVIIFKPEKYF